MVAESIPDQTASAEYLVATPVNVAVPGLDAGVTVPGVVDCVAIDLFDAALEAVVLL